MPEIEDVDRWLEDDLLALEQAHGCEDYEDECPGCGSLICWECEGVHNCPAEDDDAIEW